MGFFPYRHYTRQEGFLKGGIRNVKILSYVSGIFHAIRAYRNILWKKQT